MLNQLNHPGAPIIFIFSIFQWLLIWPAGARSNCLLHPSDLSPSFFECFLVFSPRMFQRSNCIFPSQLCPPNSESTFPINSSSTLFSAGLTVWLPLYHSPFPGGFDNTQIAGPAPSFWLSRSMAAPQNGISNKFPAAAAALGTTLRTRGDGLRVRSLILGLPLAASTTSCVLSLPALSINRSNPDRIIRRLKGGHIQKCLECSTQSRNSIIISSTDQMQSRLLMKAIFWLLFFVAMALLSLKEALDRSPPLQPRQREAVPSGCLEGWLLFHLLVSWSLGSIAQKVLKCSSGFIFQWFPILTMIMIIIIIFLI